MNNKSSKTSISDLKPLMKRVGIFYYIIYNIFVELIHLISDTLSSRIIRSLATMTRTDMMDPLLSAMVAELLIWPTIFFGLPMLLVFHIAVRIYTTHIMTKTKVIFVSTSFRRYSR